MRFPLLLCYLFFATTVHAGVVLSVNANRTIAEVAAGTPITLQSLGTAAGNAAGWQVNLQIVRESGVGEVRFFTPALPSSDYFLGSDGQANLSFTLTTDQYTNDRISIRDFDSTFPIPGVNVNGNRHLADLSFTVSDDANGIFGIYLLDQPSFLSEFTEIRGGIPTGTRFDGLQTRPTMHRIGAVSIPEPSPLLLLLLLGSAGKTIHYFQRLQAKRS